MRLYILVMLLFLSACASTTKIVDVPTVEKHAPVTIPSIQPVQVNPVNWHIYKGSDLNNLAKTSPNVVLFSLDETNFKNLQLNIADIDRYIKQNNAIKDMLTQIIIARQNEENQGPVTK